MENLTTLQPGDRVHIVQGHNIFMPTVHTGCVISHARDGKRVTGQMFLVRFTNKFGDVIESWFHQSALVKVPTKEEAKAQGQFAEPA